MEGNVGDTVSIQRTDWQSSQRSGQNMQNSPKWLSQEMLWGGSSQWERKWFLWYSWICSGTA